MANDEKTSDLLTAENEAIEKKDEAKQAQQNDNEDADSLEEQPLDIGENYVVKRSDGTWRKYHNLSFAHHFI